MPDLTSIPPSVWAQYPAMLIMLGAIIYFWREFRGVIREMNASWQAFLKEQREANNQVVCDLVGEVKVLAQGVSNLRSDFDKHNSAEMVFLQQAQTIIQNQNHKQQEK